MGGQRRRETKVYGRKKAHRSRLLRNDLMTELTTTMSDYVQTSKCVTVTRQNRDGSNFVLLPRQERTNYSVKILGTGFLKLHKDLA